MKRLRGFDKVTLRAGEAKTVEFKIPAKELAFVGLDNNRRLEQGDFKVTVGDQTATFTVNRTLIF